MKNMKKLVMAITALTMSATSAFALSACKKDKHTHDYKWTVTTEAGCESEGLETGICEADGAQTTRPVPATGHAYGDTWQVKKPTATKEGEAVKVCGNDSQHVIKVTLPKLTADGTGYEKVTDATTASGLPTKTYTYNDATNGKVEFTVISINDVNTAVKVGTEFASSVVSSTADRVTTTSRPLNSAPPVPGPYEILVENEKGEREVWLIPEYSNPADYATEGTKMGVVDEDLTAALGSEYEPYFQVATSNEILFEFGDKYVHIKNDAEKTEFFCDFDEDGKVVFPVATKWVGGGEDDDGNEIPEEKIVIRDEAASSDYLSGFGYGFTYYNIEDGAKFHGVGAFVSKLYEYAKVNPNKDFGEQITEVNGKAVYSFEFGEYLNAFNKISVKFTFNDDYVIDWAEIECKSYKTTDYNYDTNEYTANVTVNVGADDTYSVAQGHEDHWKEYEKYTITQTTSHTDGKAPVNPYNYDDMLIKSYEWEVEGATVDANDANHLTVDPTNAVSLSFKNIAPTTFNGYFDGINVYERVYSDNGSQTDASGKKYDDVLLENDYEGGADGHIKAYFHRDDHSVTLTSYKAGDHILVLKSEKTEKIITLSVPAAAPSVFYADVCHYDEVKDESLWIHSGATADATVYAGETLYFNSYVSHSAYEDSSFTATASTGATLGKGKLHGAEYSTFVADDAGVYEITLTSTKNPLRTGTITVTVIAAPDVADVINGNYWGYDNEDDVVTFTPSASGSTSGTATITAILDSKTTVENATFSYSYDATTKKFTLSDISQSLAALNPGLELTAAQNLFFTYTDSFAVSKKMCLINEVRNDAKGTFVFAANEEDAQPMVITVAGDYTINLPSTNMVAYRVTNSKATAADILTGTYSTTAYGDELVFELETESYLHGTATFNIMLGDVTLYYVPISFRYNESAKTILLEDIPEEYESLGLGLEIGEYNKLYLTYNDPTNGATKIWLSNRHVAGYTDQLTVRLLEGDVLTIWSSGLGGSAYTVSCENLVFPTSIELNKTTATVVVGGDIEMLSPTLSSGTTDIVTADDVVWTSSNPAVATVNEYGYVTAIAEGTATITCTSKYNAEVYATCVVTVQFKHVTGITLSETTLNAYVGGETQLAVTFDPEDASDKTVTWSSSDTEVVTVDDYGNVEFLKEGTATITCTSNDTASATASCAVTVTTNHVASVTVEDAKVFINGTAHLNVTLTGDDENAKVSNDKVTYSSSDTDVATVNANGVVTGVAAGTATITVTSEDGNKTATCTVTVTEPVLNAGNNEFTIAGGQSVTLTYTMTDDTAKYAIFEVSFNVENGYGLDSLYVMQGYYTTLATIRDGADAASVWLAPAEDGTIVLRFASYYGQFNSATVTVTVTETDEEPPVTADIELDELYTTDDSTANTDLIFIGEAGKEYSITFTDMFFYQYVGEVTVNGITTTIETASDTLTAVADEDGIITINCAMSDVGIYVTEASTSGGGITLGETYAFTEADTETGVQFIGEPSKSYTITFVDPYGEDIGTVKINGGADIAPSTATHTETVTAGDDGVITILCYWAEIEVTVTETPED